MKVAALAGGVGGARLADGLAQVLIPAELTVIVNTGDDFEHLGLHICPDLDTVCYTLAGLSNPETGWGLAGETFNALDSLARLGGPDWFHLGDMDLGTHLERTRRLREGERLSQITNHFCKVWGIKTRVIPATDDNAPTWVYTEAGLMPFQEYFVHQQCQPRVSGFKFAGIESSGPAPGVLEALDEADVVVLCPSNPWVSIDPILAVPGVRAAVAAAHRVIAVSPIISGQAVKGPAAKMFAELGIQPSAEAVAQHYASLLGGFVMDDLDKELAPAVQAVGLETLATQTWMRTPDDRRRLAQEVLEFGAALTPRDRSLQRGRT